MGQHNRLVWPSVEVDGVSFVEVHARGKHDVPLGRPDEDVTAIVCTAVEPVGIVESATAQLRLPTIMRSRRLRLIHRKHAEDMRLPATES